MSAAAASAEAQPRREAVGGKEEDALRRRIGEAGRGRAERGKRQREDAGAARRAEAAPFFEF